jgi:hypothetical protein
MDDAPIAHEATALGDGDDIAEGRHAILKWHLRGLPQF